MKKLFTFFVSLSAALCCLLPATAFAGGPGDPNTITASKTSANTGESISLVVHTYSTSSGSPQPLYVSVTGGSASVSPSKTTPNGSGDATFSLTASTAGTVTVVGCTDGQDGTGACYLASTPLSITFSAPAPAPTPSSSSPTSSTTAKTPNSSSTTPTPTATAPSAPSIAIKVGATQTTAGSSAPATVPQNKPILLSGTTIPNGVVTLTIHSTPRTVTVTATKDGAWTYTLTNLEPGTHHVEATVTDPTTKLTSAPAELAAFAVTPVKTILPSTTTLPAKHRSSAPFVMGGLILILLCLAGGATFWSLKRRKARATMQDIQQNTIEPNNNMAPGATMADNDTSQVTDQLTPKDQKDL